VKKFQALLYTLALAGIISIIALFLGIRVSLWETAEVSASSGAVAATVAGPESFKEAQAMIQATNQTTGGSTTATKAPAATAKATQVPPTTTATQVVPPTATTMPTAAATAADCTEEGIQPSSQSDCNGPTAIPSSGMRDVETISDDYHGQFASDVVIDPAATGLFNPIRAWQCHAPDSHGSKNTSWTLFLANLKAEQPEMTDLRCLEPIKFLLIGEGKVAFDIVRDTQALAQLKERYLAEGKDPKAVDKLKDPYDVSLQGADELRIFFQGTKKILVDGVEVDPRMSFVQLSWPRELTIHHIEIDFGKAGSMLFWQGEKRDDKNLVK